MMYNSDQIVRGFVDYADNEIMLKLPVSGRWVVGTVIGLATTKMDKVIDALVDNPIVKALDVVDENGMIDADIVIEELKKSAGRYGKITLDIPLVGHLSFTSDDVDILKRYIE